MHCMHYPRERYLLSEALAQSSHLQPSTQLKLPVYPGFLHRENLKLAGIQGWTDSPQGDTYHTPPTAEETQTPKIEVES